MHPKSTLPQSMASETAIIAKEINSTVKMTVAYFIFEELLSKSVFKCETIIIRLKSTIVLILSDKVFFFYSENRRYER